MRAPGLSFSEPASKLEWLALIRNQRGSAVAEHARLALFSLSVECFLAAPVRIPFFSRLEERELEPLIHVATVEMTEVG